jgi:hypothetical protein
VELYHALHVHEHGGSPTIFWAIWQNILEIKWTTYIEAIGFHAPAWVKGGPSFLKRFHLHVIFCFALFSYLILFHLSHASDWRSSIAPLYVVYAGCQYVWWLVIVVTWSGESIGIWLLWYQQIPFTDGEVRSELSTCYHNKQRSSSKRRRWQQTSSRLLWRSSKNHWVQFGGDKELKVVFFECDWWSMNHAI